MAHVRYVVGSSWASSVASAMVQEQSAGASNAALDIAADASGRAIDALVAAWISIAWTLGHTSGIHQIEVGQALRTLACAVGHAVLAICCIADTIGPTPVGTGQSKIAEAG